MSHTYDFLIIGQGLAGTLMAWQLQRRQKSVYIIDNQHHNAATKIAAGLINPITGRRIVKSEQIDELLPIAHDTYRALEQELNISLWQYKNILWSLSNTKEENDWYMRAAQTGIKDYIKQQTEHDEILTQVKNINGFGEVKHSAQVNVALLIEAFAQKLLIENRLLSEDFDISKLQVNDDSITYEHIKAQQVIFCEGHRALFNPFFTEVNFVVAKGEALHIDAAALSKDYILKNSITICPLPNGKFWVGSNYEWNPTNDTPTEAIKASFVTELDDFLATPYHIKAHVAAIRPTLKDRKPVMGRSYTHKNILIFNGLGTKGTSLAPFWSAHFVAHILEGKPLDTSVDIARFRIATTDLT